MEYDEMHSIAWTWQSIDGLLSRRPEHRKPWEPTPRIGEKNGSTRSLLVDGRGVPLALIVSGAETPDVSVLPRPCRRGCCDVPPRWRNRCNIWEVTQALRAKPLGMPARTGYTPALQPTREKRTDRIPDPAARRRRWAVERCHRWRNQFGS